jgi:steroid delta-isomerase-like uncharacterized protein
MSAEDNEAIVRRYFEEAFNNGNLVVIDELFAPDYVNHGSIPGQPVQDREGMKRVEQATRAALPDIRFQLDHVVASGDMVAHHWTATATHTGAFMGVPPTGRHLSAAGMVFTRIRDGKIAEQWRIVDVFGILQQLGALSSPTQPAG